MKPTNTRQFPNEVAFEGSTMVTDEVNGLFDRAATSRQPELLMDERRGHAHVNTPLEDPRLISGAIGNSSGWRKVLKAARKVAS